MFSDPYAIYSNGVKWATEAAKAFDEAGLAERAAENRNKAEYYISKGLAGRNSETQLDKVALQLDSNLENIAKGTKRS